MKRLALALCVFIALSLATLLFASACGGGEEASLTPTATMIPTEEPSATTPAVTPEATPTALTPTPQGHVLAGDTYTGTHSGSGTVQFTVSADGTRLTVFRVGAIPCDIYTLDKQGEEGVWVGTPINNNTFAVESDTLLFTGHFPRAGTAEGTLKASSPGKAGVMAPCESATLTWTATAP